MEESEKQSETQQTPKEGSSENRNNVRADVLSTSAEQEQLSEKERDEQDIQRAKDSARTHIVEAEKFRANIEVTPGTYNPDNDDDAFFVSTCHTDETFIPKMNKGKFCRS